MSECLLCRVRRSALKKYNTRKFWIGDCLSCGKPIIISRTHQEKITKREQKEAEQIVKDIFGEAFKLKKGIMLTTGHWHSHIGT